MPNKKFAFFSFVFLAFLIAGYLIYQISFVDSVIEEDKIFAVQSGESFGSVNFRLYADGLIANKTLFFKLAQIQKKTNMLKLGRFLIPHHTSMNGVLTILTSGQPISEQVLIPEGKNMYEIAVILEHSGICKAQKFLQLVKDPTFITRLGIDQITLEGYLYPETYSFSKDTTAETVIKTMVDTFNHKTRVINFTHSLLKNRHEVLTLASIVEKETGAKFERPIIAGVFVNRLLKKIRLQSDPTTIYGIFQTYKGNLSKKNLLQNTPYNTYTIDGIPPGPICSPGIQAIQAVLNPTQHSFYYFVSKNDGTHVFSKTYQDHLKAVKNFQLNRQAREGRSWREYREKDTQPTKP
jgi:UPF0755 protein